MKERKNNKMYEWMEGKKGNKRVRKEGKKG